MGVSTPPACTCGIDVNSPQCSPKPRYIPSRVVCNAPKPKKSSPTSQTSSTSGQNGLTVQIHNYTNTGYKKTAVPTKKTNKKTKHVLEISKKNSGVGFGAL